MTIQMPASRAPRCNRRSAASSSVPAVTANATISRITAIMVGTSWVFLINAASFIAVIAGLLAIRESELYAGREPALRRKGAVHHLPYGHLSVSVEILERHAARHRRGGFTAAPPE